MLSSKSRSGGSSDTANKGSNRSLNSSSSSDSRSVLKMASFAERRQARVSDMQLQISQLQEELRREKEAKLRAIDELEVAKNNFASKLKGSGGGSNAGFLEKEVERVKESERKMLESLESQTKVLAQTKIALEEAKLEISSLREGRKIGKSDSSATWSSRNLDSHFGSGLFSRSDDEVGRLSKELKLATEAEAKSKKAMDDLAIALKEVTTEANQAKQSLMVTQSELEKIRVELQHSQSLLKIAEEKFRVASKESERLKVELEDSVASWNIKEKEFVNCMKMSEEEIVKVKVENDKLFESQKSAREESSKLRDLMKQAVNEASIIKETLEIARKENARLQDLLSEKENNLQSIKQEFECLKVSEAAATDSVQELKTLLAATSTLDTSKESTATLESRNGPYPIENDPFILSNAKLSSIKNTASVENFSSGGWNGCKPRNHNGRRHSLGEPGNFNDLPSDMTDSPNKITMTLSNVTEMKVSSVITSDAELLYLDDFDYVRKTHVGDVEQNHQTQKKKRPVFRRFGDMFWRKGSEKQNSPLGY